MNKEKRVQPKRDIDVPFRVALKGLIAHKHESGKKGKDPFPLFSLFPPFFFYSSVDSFRKVFSSFPV